eukprot:TRINITY_DN17464_c0_g1_i1.p1 TRINITY_DN17464_c0_g1~~TRINITY_DN17464_c0_g1_i1.p1  ORF type:complete len:265 (+),score=78.69 TRINITY_DN17464_c0_g1_i1:820-1614(+)
MLSFDNLFIIYIIFNKMKTPRELQRKGLTIGLLSAVVFRLVFFLALGSLVMMFDAARIFFGALLIYSGLQAVLQDEDDEDFDPETCVAAQWMKCVFGDRLDVNYRNDGALWYRDEATGTLRITMLTLVVLVIEFADIIFACDSVSAKVAQVPDVYLNVTSTTLAMFVLRSLFFVMQDMIEAFAYLKHGLCIILIFVGGELCISPWADVPPAAGLGFIISVFAVCCLASVLMPAAGKEPPAAEALGCGGHAIGQTPQPVAHKAGA